MLSSIQKTIMIKAIRIRVSKGENIDEVLNSYVKLTAEDKKEIKETLKQ